MKEDKKDKIEDSAEQNIEVEAAFVSPGQDSGEPTEDKEIEELRQKVEECESRYRRALADYQNLQKRSQEERIHWIKTANKELLLRLLPVFDTLQLATKHSEDQTLKVCLQQFIDVLKAEGVEFIKAVGKEFNPHTMEAVTTAQGQEEGKVLEELRAGFIINGQTLRPAQVVVVKSEARR